MGKRSVTPNHYAAFQGTLSSVENPAHSEVLLICVTERSGMEV